MSLAHRVAHRYRLARSINILVDVPATLEARRKYPSFDELIVALFDDSFPLYRIFDGNELRHILTSGKITGGQYSVKAEREHGASWGYNIDEVVTWGNGQRGKRLGNELYLAKIDAIDKRFAHLGPNIGFDPSGPALQSSKMDASRCRTGLGCSVIDVHTQDVDNFWKVDPAGQLRAMTLAELKADLKEIPEPAPAPEPAPEPEEEFALKPKDKFVVVKGSRALGIEARNRGTVRKVKRDESDRRVWVTMDFTYPLKPQDQMWHRKPVTLYAIHANRLADHEIALMNSRGDRILIRKR